MYRFQGISLIRFRYRAMN